MSIHDICYTKSTSAIVFAIGTGSHFNMRDDLGRTPLHHVAVRVEESLESLKFLLAIGADPEMRDEDGYMPCHYAYFAKNWATLSILAVCSDHQTPAIQKFYHDEGRAIFRKLGGGVEPLPMLLNHKIIEFLDVKSACRLGSTSMAFASALDSADTYWPEPFLGRLSYLEFRYDAAQGDEDSILQLALDYFRGTGVDKDSDRALWHLERMLAINPSSISVRLHLAYAYLGNFGCTKFDQKKAFDHLTALENQYAKSPGDFTPEQVAQLYDALGWLYSEYKEHLGSASVCYTYGFESEGVSDPMKAKFLLNCAISEYAGNDDGDAAPFEEIAEDIPKVPFFSDLLRYYCVMLCSEEDDEKVEGLKALADLGQPHSILSLQIHLAKNNLLEGDSNAYLEALDFVEQGIAEVQHYFTADQLDQIEDNLVGLRMIHNGSPQSTLCSLVFLDPLAPEQYT